MTSTLALGPSDVLHSVLGLSGFAAYALVGFLAFAEAAIFVGFVLPGETAVVLGGVLANQGKVSLPVMIVVVVLAAIIGDRVLRLKLLRNRSRAVDRASAYLRDKGGRAVFLGRFTAFLRAVMPGLAGNAGMHYPRFLAFNAAGGVVWGTSFVLIGYAAGASYQRVEKIAGRASTGLLVVVVIALIANALRLRRKERKGEGMGPVG